MPTDVFISYATEDKQIADAVCHFLEARNIRTWIAPRDIPHGAEWADVVADAVANSKIVILVFSSGANESNIVKREILYAVNRRIIIIPFRIEDVLPEKALELFISCHHWLDAITPPVEKHIRSLADTVEKILEGEYVQGTRHDPIEEIESIANRWASDGYQYHQLEGINKKLQLLVKYPPKDFSLESRDALLMLMMVSIHFRGEWHFWVTKNAENPQAIRRLLEVMNISYYRPRFRALAALQEFAVSDIKQALEKMGNAIHPQIRKLIDNYVLSGKVQEYLLKIKKGDDPDLANKASAVLREISRYYESRSEEDDVSGLPFI